ncbi:MAG TPA: hypothetical protein VL860_10435, partial [Planctomycetota bacterium]|nr:hypothetical protein [Planctomycetota bacterium]
MSTVSYLQQAAQSQLARLQLRKLRHPAKAIEAVVGALLKSGPAPADTAAPQEVLQHVNTLYILLVAQTVAAGLGRSDLALEIHREVTAQQRSQARLTPYDLTTLKTSSEELAVMILGAARDTGAETFATGGAVAVLLRDLYEELLALEWTPSKAIDSAGALKRTNTRRRQHGAYYTPLPVARAIAERTLAPILAGCSTAEAVLNLRIVDPMMGPGVFLQAGGEVLVARLLELNPAATADQLWPQVAADCLYGVDLDGDATRIGAIALAFLSGAKVADLHCRPGNSLVGSVRRDVDVPARMAKQLRALKAARLVAGPVDETLPEPCLNWARAFPAVFGGAREGRPGWNGARLTGGFDALLSNPPYVSYYSRDSVKNGAASLEEDFFHHAGILDAPLPESLRGRTNLFLLALFAGEQLLAREAATDRVAGAAGWLLPDTFLSNESYAGWRRYFLEAARLTAVEWVRGDLFGEPSLGSSVVYFGDARNGTVSVDLHDSTSTPASITASRGRPKGKSTKKAPAAATIAEPTPPRREQFAVAEILQFPHLVIPTMPRRTRQLVARIEAASVPITSWMEVRDGVNPGPRSFRDRIVLAAPDSTD